MSSGTRLAKFHITVVQRNQMMGVSRLIGMPRRPPAKPRQLCERTSPSTVGATTITIKPCTGVHPRGAARFTSPMSPYIVDKNPCVIVNAPNPHAKLHSQAANNSRARTAGARLVSDEMERASLIVVFIGQPSLPQDEMPANVSAHRCSRTAPRRYYTLMAQMGQGRRWGHKQIPREIRDDQRPWDQQ